MKSKVEIKASMMEQYSKAVDELLEANEQIDNFVDLEKVVGELAEKTLPKVLGELQEGHTFSPKVLEVQRASKE